MTNQEELNKIAQQVKNCRKCPLYQTATHPVPGEGNPEAEIVLIGEAPGYWEDQKGVPFVGAAGNLLDQLLAIINLQRDQVFIGNILKHRPPNNRDPLPEEIIACAPYLRQQLLIIKPKIVITLGRFALNYFLPNASISRIHGQPKKLFWENLKLIIIPMYHPAAALRNRLVLQELKADFRKIPKIIEKIKDGPSSTQQIQQEKLF